MPLIVFYFIFKLQIYLFHIQKTLQMKKGLLYALCLFTLYSCSSQKQKNSEKESEITNSDTPTKELPPTIISLDDLNSSDGLEQKTEGNQRIYSYSDSQDVDGTAFKFSAKISVPDIAPRDDSKGHDYSNLPNYDATLSPSKVVEYYLTNLAGGRLSEARKFASESTVSSLLFYGTEDRNPLIEDYEVNILEETINGEEATFKIKDTMGDFIITVNKIDDIWVFAGMRSVKKE